MMTLKRKHYTHWSNADLRRSTWQAVGLFLLSLMVMNFANIFAVKNQGNAVPDIILSNVPVFDIDGIILLWVFVVIGVVVALLVLEPKRIPFLLKSVAVFILIRSVFITMTHLGPFPEQAETTTNVFLRAIGLGGTADFFFSGHTGLPFMLSLMFAANKKLRLLFLVSSVGLGIGMLLTHLHYSIDVFAAFFITYTIFHLCLWFFPKDHELFLLQNTEND